MFEEEFKDAGIYKSLQGESTNDPFDAPLESVEENLLAKMVDALYKVQSQLEMLVFLWGVGNSINYEEYYKEKPEEVYTFVGHHDIEHIIAPHKLSILQGLACLKRPHLKSYETVLDALYHIFKKNGNLLVLEQVCVLLTGMGLVNVHGRWAFC